MQNERNGKLTVNAKRQRNSKNENRYVFYHLLPRKWANTHLACISTRLKDRYVITALYAK